MLIILLFDALVQLDQTFHDDLHILLENVLVFLHAGQQVAQSLDTEDSDVDLLVIGLREVLDELSESRHELVVVHTELRPDQQSIAGDAGQTFFQQFVLLVLDTSLEQSGQVLQNQLVVLFEFDSAFRIITEIPDEIDKGGYSSEFYLFVGTVHLSDNQL